MNWVFIADIIYLIILVLVWLRIVYDTDNTTNTPAYLLLVVFFLLLACSSIFPLVSTTVSI
jgi:cardiolipin synthase